MMKKKLCNLLIILPILTLFIPVHTLKLIEPKSGKVVKSFHIKNGEEFTVLFTHSVERTPVYETYYVKNDEEIYLKETIYFSFGAGLPATTKYEFSIEKEGMKITNINEKIDHLVYRAGGVIANHALIIKEKSFFLEEFVGTFKPIVFKAKKEPLYKYLRREVLHIE